MIRLESFGVLPEIERSGRWEASIFPGVSFLVRPEACGDFQYSLKEAQAANASRYGDQVPDPVAIGTMGRLIAEHLLRGWNGFDEPYTPSFAAEILADPEYRIIAAEILRLAERVSIPALEFVQ